MPASAVARLEELAAPVAAGFSPVARDYPSRVLVEPLSPAHFGCSIKERGDYTRDGAMMRGDY